MHSITLAITSVFSDINCEAYVSSLQNNMHAEVACLSCNNDVLVQRLSFSIPNFKQTFIKTCVFHIALICMHIISCTSTDKCRTQVSNKSKLKHPHHTHTQCTLLNPHLNADTLNVRAILAYIKITY